MSTNRPSLPMRSNALYSPTLSGGRFNNIASRNIASKNVTYNPRIGLNSNLEAGSFRNNARFALGNRSLGNESLANSGGLIQTGRNFNGYNFGSLLNRRNVNYNGFPSYYTSVDPRLNYNPVVYPNGYPGYPIARPNLLVYGNGTPYQYGPSQFSYNPYTYSYPSTSPACAAYAGAAAISDPVLCRENVYQNGGTPQCARQICGGF